MIIKRVLVTGSSGMIGTRLCEKLLEKGFEVGGVDIRSNSWNADIDRLTTKADLRDTQAVLDLPGEYDAVIHLAANARVFNLVVDPSLARDNIETTFNVLEYVRQKKVPSFFLASSREVYGNTEHELHAEDDVILHGCESPYTASKMAGEALTWSYHRCYQLPFIIFRFSNVYGRYDDSDRVVPLFIRKALRGEELTVFGKEKKLDFTYIDDTVNGICLGIERFADAQNQVINIACQEGYSLEHVAETIKELLRSNSPIRLQQNRTGEVMRYVADISKAKRLLGYAPRVSLREGIERSIAWYAPRESAGQ